MGEGEGESTVEEGGLGCFGSGEEEEAEGGGDGGGHDGGVDGDLSVVEAG